MFISINHSNTTGSYHIEIEEIGEAYRVSVKNSGTGQSIERRVARGEYSFVETVLKYNTACAQGIIEGFQIQ